MAKTLGQLQKAYGVDRIELRRLVLQTATALADRQIGPIVAELYECVDDALLLLARVVEKTSGEAS